MNAAPQLLSFSWRSTSDSVAVHALHQRAAATEPVGTVRADPPEHFARHHGDLGQLVGCFREDGTLVAYGVLALALPIVTTLATILGVDAGALCVLDGSAVEPAWRGQRLHDAAIGERLRRAAALGRSQAAATVAPQNIHSLRGLLRAGFEVRRFVVLYGGLPRFVVYRPIHADPVGPHFQGHLNSMGRAAQPRDALDTSLELGDLAAHQAALGAGLVGYACRQDAAGGWRIDYRPARHGNRFTGC